MKKNIIILSLLLVAACINATSVTSTLDGGVISKLPKVGQIVKKGEMLVVFGLSKLDAEIDVAKIEVELAKELLKNKILDKERANKLVGKGISKNDWEECIYDAVAAKLSVAKKEADLRKLETDKPLHFIAAPWDCKVTKDYMIENSGTFVGQKILQVERIN